VGVWKTKACLLVSALHDFFLLLSSLQMSRAAAGLFHKKGMGRSWLFSLRTSHSFSKKKKNITRTSMIHLSAFFFGFNEPNDNPKYPTASWSK
jgi:hypothetical protein